MATIPSREAGDRSITSSMKFTARQSALASHDVKPKWGRRAGAPPPEAQRQRLNPNRGPSCATVSGGGAPALLALPQFARALPQQLPSNDQQLNLLRPLEDVEDLRVPRPLH